MGRRVLITGGCGFAGSHIVEELNQYEDLSIIILDCLTYAARLENVPHTFIPTKYHKPIRFVWHDFRLPLSDSVVRELGKIDYIIHNGAESHVSRSFADPGRFLESNVFGTMNLLETARKLQPEKFIYISTDEVFGSRTEPAGEDAMLDPCNPYAATKAGGELLALSYHHSYKLPVIVTHCMNMFGERQHVEKFVPMVIRKILRGEMLDIHGEMLHGAVWVPYSRKWTYVRNEANALGFLLKNGENGARYNIAGIEQDVLGLAQRIAKILDLPLHWKPVTPEALDRNYAVSDAKIRGLGWGPPHEFEVALAKTVKWYAEHQEYLEV